MERYRDYGSAGNNPPPPPPPLGSDLPHYQQTGVPPPWTPPPPPEEMGTGKIVGLSALACCVPLIGPLISLIIGIIERAKKGAVVVIVVAGVMLVMGLPMMGIMATISVPLLMSARSTAVDEKARNSLRAIVSAEAAYFARHGEYADFAALEAADYIDSRFDDNELGQGILITQAPVGGGPAFTCTIVGESMSFTADETGEIKTNAL